MNTAIFFLYVFVMAVIGIGCLGKAAAGTALDAAKRIQKPISCRRRNELPKWCQNILIALVVLAIISLAAYGFYYGCTAMYEDIAAVGGLILWPI